MINNTPKISVIMAAYNCEKYLKEAILSILSQTFSDFEFIIINDCSTDNSLEIIKSFNDPRIVLVENEKNLGLPNSLNKGISISRGEFIARMDGDDISLPNRFSEQVRYMEKHRDIVMCGTSAKSIGMGKQVVMKHPSNPDEIKVNLLFKTSFIHPTVMIRRDFLLKNKLEYNPEFLQTQDYELFSRISQIGKVANIPKVLLYYRKHEKQASTEKMKNQIEYAKKIIKRQLDVIKLNPTEEDLDIAVSVKRYLFLEDKLFPIRLEKFMLKIKEINDISKIYSDQALKKIFGQIWIDVALSYQSHKINTWKIFWNGKPRKWIKIDLKNIYRISKIFLSNFYLGTE